MRKALGRTAPHRHCICLVCTDMTSTVCLVIKNPAQSADFRCKLSVQARVADLKRMLEVEYANHPAPDHQKIIFAGKLLQDDCILADLLQQV